MKVPPALRNRSAHTTAPRFHCGKSPAGCAGGCCRTAVGACPEFCARSDARVQARSSADTVQQCFPL